MTSSSRPRFRTLTPAALLTLWIWSVSAVSAQTLPEACDPGPVDTVSAGHIALFDVYWDSETETLNNHPCPPTVVHTPGGTDPLTGLPTPPPTTRTATAIDIGYTIIHVPRSARQRVTADGNGPYDGIHYGFLRTQWTEDDDGNRTQSIADSAPVWIVPSCHTTLAPPFCLGFFADLLQPGDWRGDIQYEIVSMRHRVRRYDSLAGPGEVYIFGVRNGYPSMTWSSSHARSQGYTDGRSHVSVTPGTHNDFSYWAFTRPGTYEFQVRVKGHPASTISSAATVTSEVRRYTFHVDELTLNEQPRFQVERSVMENAAGGVAVGAPIAVTDSDDSLEYWLTGEESLPFAVASVAGGAQLTVAAGARLDFETQATYYLTLNVSDDKSRTSQSDDGATDHTIAVQITLEDDPSETTP